ncbi:hypothetical protein [Pseudomonas sp. S2_B07]
MTPKILSFISTILPVTLLFLSFMVKMSIEREVDLPKALQSLIELPTDIMFLSSSLLIAYIISNKNNAENGLAGLLGLLGCVIISVLVVLIWRKAENQLSKKSWHALWLCIASYLTAIPILVITVFINIGQGA